ncbi:hypothetical protein [Altererythrobacter sp. GH1-8]|uniref:Nmad3 family putative nucleotide modification protein n=1 Tax=Altererythrobacter sp. GH1-8 TaxID=3349333 RepID=UPI00374D352D
MSGPIVPKSGKAKSCHVHIGRAAGVAMRIIFSRKGFDSTAGGGASPIVDNRPVSLPIPDSKGLSNTTYDDLGLGEYAARASRGKLGPADYCHHDPMFLDNGTAILGQVGSSQSHLANQRVRAGDVFLFFGLFDGKEMGRHHRIFGYLLIEEIVPLAGADERVRQMFLDLNHPHAIGMHGKNDTLYLGEGRKASRATDRLRLTAEGEVAAMWARPPWLRRGEITYFPDRDENWPEGRLYRVGNGQEFVADIGQRKAPREWLAEIIAEIRRD